MARKSNREDSERPQLTMARADARAAINKQIAAGAELVQFAATTTSLEQIRDRRSGWKAYTTELLRKILTTDKFVMDFKTWHFGEPTFKNGLEAIQAFRQDIKDSVASLRTIHEMLDLFDESIPVENPLNLIVTPEIGSTKSAIPDRVRIFISHSSADAKVAEALANLLRVALSLSAGNIRCTSALAHSLPYGVDPAEALRREVSEADMVIGLVTSSSVESHWVLFELGARWGANKPLFTVLASGADHDILPAPIRSWHALKVVSGDSARIVKLVVEVGSELKITCPQSHHYQTFVDSFAAAACAEAIHRKNVSPVSPEISLEAFKRQYCYEEPVSWKYDESGKRDGPFCPNCIDDGMERRLNPLHTKGNYQCVVHRVTFRTAEYKEPPRPPVPPTPSGWI